MLSERLLQVKLKNTLQSTPLALNPVSSVLNREETLSVQNKVRTCNPPEVDQPQHTEEQNFRVSVIVYVFINMRGNPLVPECCSQKKRVWQFFFIEKSVKFPCHSFFNIKG